MKKLFLVSILIVSVFFAWGKVASQEKQPGTEMKPALLVIDIQNEYLPLMSEQDKKMALFMINGAISIFREHGFPVIPVYHTDPQWGPKPGTGAFEFPKSVIIKPEDAKIIKNYPSAFKKTGLEKRLQDKGCNTLFLCGLSATGCVLATYHTAADLDFNVFMIKNALISPNTQLTQAVERICETLSLGAVEIMLKTGQK
jgi:nicotinamidase-related amidase